MPSIAPHRQSSLPRGVFWIVAIAAIAINAFSMAANHLWIFPDSIDYIELAGGIVRRFDLTNELYLVRTPAYPLFLAALFALLGQASAAAILILQHAMLVATALFTAAIARQLTEDRRAAFISGIICACSPQLLAYSNMALTEIPYTLCVVACVWALIRFLRGGRSSVLGVASLLTGVAYLIRPVGLILVGVCLIATLLHEFEPRGDARRLWWAPSLRTLALRATWATVPAVLVATPWMLLSASSHRSLQASRCLDYVLYFRAVTTENFADESSSALREIRDTVNAAITAGELPNDGDYRERATVMKAYEAVRGQSFAASSAVMGRAGRELLWAHPWRVATGTLKYSAWMLMSPDPVIRFLPGGAPGIDGRRDGTAGIYGIDTYSRGEGSWERTLAHYNEYLPLETKTRLATPAYAAFIRAFISWFDRPLKSLGTRHTLYEIITGLALFGLCAGLFFHHRRAWILVIVTLSLQVGVSAFLGGPQARYAAPASPLLALGVAFSATTVLGIVIRVGRILAGTIIGTPTQRALVRAM